MLNMQGKAQLARHGENNFIPVSSVPEGARLVEQGKSVIAGHSESMHNHVLTLDKVAPKEAEIKIFEHEGVTYLDVPFQAKLQHQKTVEAHPTITFAPGVYRKADHMAFDLEEKVMKRQID